MAKIFPEMPPQMFTKMPQEFRNWWQNFKSWAESIFWPNGSMKLPSLTDAEASNNSLYYSTTASKAVYKDSAGTVHNLY